MAASSSPKLTSSVAGALSVLTLQGVSAPFVLAQLVQGRDTTTPHWLTGLYTAVELGAIAAGLLVAWGIHAKRRHAYLAPAVLMFPYWLAIAVAGPIVFRGLEVPLFSGFAASMGAITALPFLSTTGRALFAPRSTSPSRLTLTAGGR
jgi:hypothetical protein